MVARSPAQEADGAGAAAPSSPAGPTGTDGQDAPGEAGRAASAPPASAPLVSPFSNAPTDRPETPQERRKRQNDERREQAMLDSQAAAQRKAARLKAQREEEEREAARAAEQAALGVPVPEPFQMGFASAQDAGEAPPGAGVQSPQTEPSHQTEPSQQIRQPRQIERLPASLRRPADPARGTVQRLPSGDAAPARAASRNLAPIRIGWDEDDSWRVVRTAPEARPTPPLPRWAPLALVALAVLLALALVWALGPARTSAAAPAPASAGGGVSSPAVTFTVRGAAGVTAQLSVVSAPAGANLSADQTLGVVPGQVRFPVAGTYRLQVLARGYRPATLDLTVPRTQPVTIDLGN